MSLIVVHAAACTSRRPHPQARYGDARRGRRRIACRHAPARCLSRTRPSLCQCGETRRAWLPVPVRQVEKGHGIAFSRCRRAPDWHRARLADPAPAFKAFPGFRLQPPFSFQPRPSASHTTWPALRLDSLKRDVHRLRPAALAALGLGAASQCYVRSRCPSTELRGNLAYCSILAAAGLQCATPWPALIRNRRVRNRLVCLFYPGVSPFGDAPRKYSEASVHPAGRAKRHLPRPLGHERMRSEQS